VTANLSSERNKAIFPMEEEDKIFQGNAFVAPITMSGRDESGS